MYELPKKFYPAVLIGHELEMVCFSAYQLYLHFDGKIIITIEGHFSYQNSPGTATKVLALPVTSSEVMQAIGQTIQSASGDNAGTLTITFANGHQLMCFDSSKQYESYQIALRDELIVV